MWNIKSLWGLACKLFFFAVLGLFFLPSCTEEEDERWATLSDLSFSHDTVRFDSVFSAEVSPTKLLRIYNRSSLPVRLSRLSLVGGSASSFALLIDGAAATEKEELRIGARDSLTLVIRLRPNAGGKESLLVADEVEITTHNNATRRLHLEAWGLPHTDLEGGEITKDTDWTGNPALIISKPLVVAKGVTLRITPGAALYFRPNASLTVYGRLVVEGTVDRRVLFAGTRLDTAYKYTPGQWQGLLLMPSSGPHTIRNATFRSAVTAIRTDSILESCELENVIITSCSRDAIALRKSTLRIVGSILAQNSGAALSLRGARVTMDFCTLSGDTRFGQPRRSSLILLDTPPAGSENSLHISNSIVWGEYSNEIRAIGEAKADVLFATHSIFKWTSLRPSNASEWQAVLYSDPLLEAPAKLNLELKEASPARSSGLIQNQDGVIFYDLKGRKRLHPDGTVDRGALVYEKKPQTQSR